MYVIIKLHALHTLHIVNTCHATFVNDSLHDTAAAIVDNVVHNMPFIP